MGSTAVTVLGTGLMGAGIARSLARAGHEVTVWNRSTDKAREVADEPGVTFCENLKDALRGAEVIVTMLFDADAVAAVMRAALPGAGQHAVWVQNGTVGLDATASLAELAGRHEVAFVDAPVLGTRQPTEDDTLIVLAAGVRALRGRVEPVFDAIGSRTIWVSEQPGDGHRLKLVANSWVLSVTGATAQSIGFADRLGVDPQLFLDAIAGGPLDCGYAHVKGSSMIEKDVAPSFGRRGAAKDNDLIATAMHEAGTEDRVGSTFELVSARGHGEEDMSSVILAFSE